MTLASAARLDDELVHSSKLIGWAAGAAVGALIGVATVASGGTFLVVLGAAAAGAAAGGVVGLGAGAIFDALSEVAGVRTGTLQVGSSTVQINRKPAIAVLDSGYCCFPVIYQHYQQSVVEGSASVFMHCRPASRKGDELLCGAIIASGSKNVLIGGERSRVKGTRRTGFDTFLDYSSWFLTGMSFGLGPGATAATVGISSLFSYGMNKLSEAGAWSDLLMNKVIGAVPLAATVVETVLSVRSHNASVVSTMWKRYMMRKLAEGGVPWSRIRWENNNFVRNSINGQLRSVGSSISAVDKAGGAVMGLGIVVDVARVWRDVERAGNVPDVHEVCCDDRSWLEPA